MIEFLKFYIGNKDEAFFEDNLKSNVNIIYSNDNNKGKTIVLQGLYYALGNTPIFPSGFNYKNYYFIVDFVSEGQFFSVCRKDKTFLFRNNKNINIFDDETEFKRFFDKNVLKLPRIIKGGQKKLVDLELFLQIFFVGQDKRDTSKIFNNGYYNKDDFMEMLYSYAGCSKIISNSSKKDIKEKQLVLEEERKILQKQQNFLKQNSKCASFLTYTSDKDNYLRKINNANIIRKKLIDLKNEKNRIYNRKIKNEDLIKELNSLNRTLSEGALVCLDCHSSHIGFENKNKDINFDVSNSDIRSDIMTMIKNRIESYDEILEKLNYDIISTQNELTELFKEDDISLETLFFYKEDIKSSQNVDQRSRDIDEQLKEYSNLLDQEKEKNISSKESRNEVLNDILLEMNSLYKELEPTGNFSFDSLFSKRNINYSGSEECEFYLTKLYALAKVLNHPFPIVMDAFREGELSTKKENLIIKRFADLPNQVIFTATLKDQEQNKYTSLSNINDIDYSKHTTHHLLNNRDINKLQEKLKEFSIFL